MQALESSPSLDTLSSGQRTALISLLVDDDPAIYQMVRSRLLACGPLASQWLRPYTLSSDPRMRRRATEIVHHQARLLAHEQFIVGH